MRVLITRPQPEASRWVGRLRTLGVEAVALPLIQITQRHSPELENARSQLPALNAVMFVSPTSVEAFFAEHVRVTSDMSTRFLATGPGTVRALRQRGIDPSRIDAPALDSPRFDSEALWATLAHRDWDKQRVLLVRGEGETGSRDWLAVKLKEAGARVSWVTAYERLTPQWSPEELELAHQACGDGSVWVFSSSQAVLHLLKLCPGLPWHQTPCICTHERIARTAQALGFTRIQLCRPVPEELAAICHAQ